MVGLDQRDICPSDDVYCYFRYTCKEIKNKKLDLKFNVNFFYDYNDQMNIDVDLSGDDMLVEGKDIKDKNKEYCYLPLV